MLKCNQIDYDLQSLCPTEVDADGIPLRDGICGPECLMHYQLDALNWMKDETVKMTLQYNHNQVLWAGLEMYGILSSCFLLYSLILTALISAIGKIIIGRFLGVAGI